jgi:hypothetical protein
MPDRWNDAYFENLRAEGAFLVTAKLEDGEIAGALITSEAGLPCEVVNPFGNAKVVVTRLDGERTSQTLEGEIVSFDTVAGGQYLLTRDGSTTTAEMLAPPVFERTELDRNFYGLKEHPRF